MQTPEIVNATTSQYKLTFTTSVGPNETTTFVVTYSLLSNAYFTKLQNTANNFNLTFPLFYNTTYYMEAASVTFVFPEGARIAGYKTATIGQDYNIAKGVFQETLSIEKQRLISLDGFSFEITYEYNPFWLSFRPALWIWAISIVGCAIAAVWRRPREEVHVVAPVTGARVRGEDARTFIESYEEKMKIAGEIDGLEAKVQKGRIPRRRYKVQRKVLETRLSTLSRSLNELKERMCAAGGHYFELMRQVEVAETDINEAETNIKSIEARHARGELSLEAYRKLLADYQRRKERADTAIDGVLLRLREEIR
jgi:hypothetical protein